MSLAPALLPDTDVASVPPAIDPADPLAVAKAQASLPGRGQKVLRELILLADAGGQVQVQQIEIAEATRFSLRTIRLALKELEAAGWISRQIVSLGGAAGRAPDRITVHPAPRVPASAR